MSLTLFFEHLHLQVFIFGVFNGVVIRTIVILITEATRVEHLVSWKEKVNHQKWFCGISQLFEHPVKSD